MIKRLSKSKYLSGLQCSKRLWLELNAPDKASPISEAQQRTFDQGTQVGIEAHRHFPGGLLIEVDHNNLDRCVRETRQAIDNNVPAIFEAGFFFDAIYVIADIITKNPDGSWDLIEVKSSTKVHDEHIHDLAVQRFVLEKSELSVEKTSVMHINNQCVYPDLSNLFTTEDVTEQVKKVMPDVPKNLAALKDVIRQKSEPDIRIGDHCRQPHECPFKDYCWQNVGNRAIFDIPKLPKAKKLELREKGIISIDQLPADYPLSEAQRAYVNRMLNDEMSIDSSGIKKRLSELQYPLYFFDFETDNPAIPKFEGARPYQQVPFQYSCHVLHKDGALEHYEYLHMDDTDPRLPLTQSLVSCIKETGSIIAYYARFEKGVLIDLANSCPQYAGQLRAMAARLWDQLDIFKQHYKHASFGNSNSIKAVLPVLVPELTYQTLEVRKGDQAQSVWSLMIQTEDKIAKDQMAKNLKAYCELDTLAMVKIHNVLEQIE